MKFFKSVAPFFGVLFAGWLLIGLSMYVIGYNRGKGESTPVEKAIEKVEAAVAPATEAMKKETEKVTADLLHRVAPPKGSTPPPTTTVKPAKASKEVVVPTVTKAPQVTVPVTPGTSQSTIVMTQAEMDKLHQILGKTKLSAPTLTQLLD